MRADSSDTKTPPHKSDDWSVVEESLRDLGVLKYAEVTQSARQRSCSLEHCLDLIAHYREKLASNQHGWQAPAYVLLRRFQSASPNVAVNDGWFGSSTRPDPIATQRQTNLQKTKDLLEKVIVPEHERAKAFSKEDHELIANFGNKTPSSVTLPTDDGTTLTRSKL